MIERGDGDDATKAGQRHNLMQMIGYAEDELECRRKMLLGHFKEHFTKQMCKGTCDNCRRGATSEQRDVSAHAKAALRLVHEARTRLTLTMVADTLKGSTRAELAKKRLTGTMGRVSEHSGQPAHGPRLSSSRSSSLPLQTTLSLIHI